jgi:hypothetical protein
MYVWPNCAARQDSHMWRTDSQVVGSAVSLMAMAMMFAATVFAGIKRSWAEGGMGRMVSLAREGPLVTKCLCPGHARRMFSG